MSYDTKAALENKKFWNFFIKDNGENLHKSGWEGELTKEALELGKNWDVIEYVFFDAVFCNSNEI